MTEAPAASTIGDWLCDNAAAFPDKIALQFEDGRSWTYPALDRWADVIAARLQTEHHVEHGDRVAFLGFNHPAMIALLFACARLGAVLVPLNWRLAPAELAFIAADCGPRVLFADTALKETAQSVAQSVDGLKVLPLAGIDNAQ
ncbi:MAG: AMP-binding protein, partial [Aestuariivirgaceae bacterium]